MVRKKLILFRHAKSDWHSDVQTDIHRPLNLRGKRDAPIMGQWLADKAFLPDLVVCSVATRARQTYKLASGVSGWHDHRVEVRYSNQLYSASIQIILSLLDEGFQDYDRLMIVGHNPVLEDVLLQLCPEDMSLMTGGKLMTTSAIAVIDYISPGVSTLLSLIRPSDLTDSTKILSVQDKDG